MGDKGRYTHNQKIDTVEDALNKKNAGSYYEYTTLHSDTGIGLEKNLHSRESNDKPHFTRCGTLMTTLLITSRWGRIMRSNETKKKTKKQSTILSPMKFLRLFCQTSTMENVFMEKASGKYRRTHQKRITRYEWKTSVGSVNTKFQNSYHWSLGHSTFTTRICPPDENKEM